MYIFECYKSSNLICLVKNEISIPNTSLDVF